VPENPADPKRIDASPTKEFFIYMLTRDIPLTRAILDLVDNSLDGARRMRPNGDFDGLWVRAELDKDHFKIADNCGGIPFDIARHYAFRFGRSKDAPLTPGSVGQFGVGMKRTFFKLGRHFSVHSVTSSSRFNMDIDVAQWMALDESEKADEWHFEFQNIEDKLIDVPKNEVGTRLEVTQLYDTVGESFGLENFLTRLKQEMSLAHSISMDKGLAITVNTIPLRHEPQTLFESDQMKPAFIERTYQGELLNGKPDARVNVKLYAGVAERSLHDGGWYVFCNGRMVIRADQTSTTIWGQTHGMRQYHPDVAYFRGYAYFDSDDAGLLPWTTTKTGVDIDSAVYKSAQLEMVEISKPVLTFLSNLAKEKAAIESGDIGDSTLEEAIHSAEAKRTDSLAVTRVFVAPQPRPRPPGPRMARIQYSKPLTEVEKAKELLDVHTFTAVGEKTFEYFMHYEEKQ